MDVHNPEQRSKNMRAIRSTNTKAEVRLAKALWHLGYRYRKNNRTVFGKPDLTFKKLKIAIFVDSEFFHGKDWETQKDRIKLNIGTRKLREIFKKTLRSIVIWNHTTRK